MRSRVFLVLFFLSTLPTVFDAVPAACGQVVDTSRLRPAKTLDENLFLSINHYGYRHAWLDEPMKGLSNSMSFTSIGIPGALYLYGMSANDKDEAITGLSIALSEGLSGIISQALKLIIQRERPYHVLEDDEGRPVRLPGTPAGGYSMPSGHSTAAWALATSLSLHYPKSSVILPSLLYALGVSISRPYLGVHYPSDILVGAIIGSGVAYLTYHYESEIMSRLTWALPDAGGGTQKMIVTPFLAPLGISLTIPVFEP
jgi:membrane-associated phospholipid phosphatase